MSTETGGNATKSKKDILMGNVTSSARKALDSFVGAHRSEVKPGITAERRARQQAARAEARAKRPENPGVLRGLGFLGMDIARIAADMATGMVEDELRVASKVDFRGLADKIADGIEDGLHNASRELRGRNKRGTGNTSTNTPDSK
ncbi:MAG TPA: hypothetical protein VHE53_03900 [Patescibacteria group bacterium]|nr:hypothetical protein [Patescibacteria group bacterium]